MDFINEILKWSLACMLLLQAYILIFNRGVPNWSSSRHSARTIAKFLQKHFQDKSIEDPIIYDLGSGRGTLTNAIARAIPNAKVIGLEFSPIAIKQAEHRADKKDIDNVTYKQGDFTEKDLSNANAIVLFLNAESIGSVTDKIKETNFKPGTILLSSRFKLHDWEPDNIIQTKQSFLKQGEINLYHLA